MTGPDALDDATLARLRRWASAYKLLMRGGLSEQAHTACVTQFEDEAGVYPFVTADDVSSLVAEVERLRAVVGRVEALADDCRHISPLEAGPWAGGWLAARHGVADLVSDALRAPESPAGDA